MFIPLLMAGIYVHIPFCKQACVYCNFHFSTNLQTQPTILHAIIKEIEYRKEYLQGEKVDTIYFGGGTPSLLAPNDLQKIVDTIKHNFLIDPYAEYTIEVNPDDMTMQSILDIRSIGFNRLSIGIQSFHEDDMRYMHRAHSALQAHNAIDIAQLAGIKNISIDLIYGIPGRSIIDWKKNLDIAWTKNIQHLSCYALTIEPKTALYHQIQAKKTNPPTDDDTIQQLEYLMDTCNDHGFEQYEISNFSVPGYRSNHNSNYWNRIPYLGIGPSAHSYNGHSRQWNIANNLKYAKAIEHGTAYFEIESLTEEMIYNESVMTKLRTRKGLPLDSINPRYIDHFLATAQYQIDKNLLYLENGYYILTKEGMFISDHVIMELFV